MPAKINLINQKIGELTVKKETHKRKNNSIVWECECSCGTICEFSTKELRSDGVMACKNCAVKRQPQTNLTEDIVLKKYNHLTVLEKTELKSGGKILYKCQCDCGNPNFVYASRTDLINSHTQSCGCVKFKYKKGDIINNRLILSPYSSKNETSTNKDYHYYLCKCLLCNNIYDASAQTLEKTISCGCLNASIGETFIANLLDTHNISYQKEYVFMELPSLRYDFAIFENNEIIRLIEFDGEHHFAENIKNSGWNTQSHYEKTIKNDIIKNEFAKKKNIPLVRIPYQERYNLSLELLMSNQYLIK